MVKVSDHWIPKVGEIIYIDEYFYNGTEEFEVISVNEETGDMECSHDGIVYRIDYNYYRQDISLKNE